MVYLLKKTNFLIHLCHDKGKKQRSLHYPFSNSARNAVVIREVKRVLSTLRGWYYVSISPPPLTPLPWFSRWGGTFWQFDVAFIVHVFVDYLIDVGEGEGTL